MSARRLFLFGIGCLLALAAPSARAEDRPMTGFLDRVHKDADGKEAKYVLFVPKDYDAKADKSWPVILFLHGAGETQGGTKQPVEVGIGTAIKAHEKTFPFITIFPQSQKRTWQAGSADADRALAILDEVMKGFKTDPKRVYLTGLSMGGYGTWSLAQKYPERWAAIAPICGGIGRSSGADDFSAAAAKVKDVPCWDFHGDADPAVPVAQSRGMMKALWDAGAHPNYTEYPGVGHNSWDKAYATADLYEWLLKHKSK
ncbi:MAG TPA: dienelactone hydrolase family protein [Gemmataceae bacterium]|nr:dienelactone hydrolase family protein [Gemmataceae bacterium]